MKTFMTEKQIEDLLVNETRMLPLPGGGEQVMTGPKLMWQSVDFFINASIYTQAELIGFTRRTMTEKGYSFDDAFKSVIAYIDGRISR
jgi:hypothetical protein